MPLLCNFFVAFPSQGSSFSLYAAVMSYCLQYEIEAFCLCLIASMSIRAHSRIAKILILSNPLVQVELERLRLLCERIVKREKLKVAVVFFSMFVANYMAL